MVSKRDIELMTRGAARAWATAARKLAIAVVAPALLHDVGGTIEFLCLLPHFGSSHGMVVGWALLSGDGEENDKDAFQMARRNGLFCSLPNLEAYSRFNEERFKEALTDWGYFGPESARPKWLPRQQ
ncbi:MAG: hypothetical protein ACREDR_40365 [Blastocatellia bacterium]